ncbi:MAG: glycine betaine ABC transporter substrate-binding protein [Desulfopila sp.]
MHTFTSWKAFLLRALLLCCLIMPAISAQAADQTVKLAYVEWSSEIASTNVVKAVLQEEMGVNCRIIAMKADEMWEAVATGEVDGTVAAWLPLTHAHYLKTYQSDMVDLGPNLEGAKIGLVVPNVSLGRQTAATGLRNTPYIKADTIGDLQKYAGKFKHRIIGIDPESGVMQKTREAIEAYGLDNYELVAGSEVSMTAELGHAIQRQKWVVVTGWVPHWKFARWELKFLEDPKNIYGDKENIHTFARQGLKEDMPKVYELLDNFQWTPQDMGQLMIWIHDDNGMYPYDKALRFIKAKKDLVQSWVP